MLGALQRALDRKLLGIMANRGIAQRTMGDVSYSRSAGVGGVGDCTRLLRTLGGLGETSGPRIDRIPPTRPPWWRRQYRELKKLIFSPPSTCPIHRFGPVANRTVLGQLHNTLMVCMLVSLQASWVSPISHLHSTGVNSRTLHHKPSAFTRGRSAWTARQSVR